MSTSSWMERKKITLNKIGNDGKPEETQVTVNTFVKMYNDQNVVFTKINDYSQALLGQLYKENPDNAFFKHCVPNIVEFAKKRAELIVVDPNAGIVKEPELAPETKPDLKLVEKEKPEETF